jgi:uncharacterized protein (DUF983 family)
VSSPYDDLDRDARPGPPAVPHASSEPGAIQALLRGAVRRCPRCGSGRLFQRWLRIRDRCPRCRLRLEREEGGFLGAMVINYGVTTLVWIVLLVVWLVVDLPDVHVAQLTIASIVVVAIFPLIWYPFSKTLWAAADYLVFRTTPEYAIDRAEGDGRR